MKAPAWVILAVVTAASAILTACGGAGSGSRPTAAAGAEFVIVTPAPGSPAVAPTPAADRRYVVAEGDTLSGIAARFGVTEAALQTANGVDDPNRLVVGQELIIPAEEP